MAEMTVEEASAIAAHIEVTPVKEQAEALQVLGSYAWRPHQRLLRMQADGKLVKVYISELSHLETNSDERWRVEVQLPSRTWVERFGKTLDEAAQKVLDELGVA